MAKGDIANPYTWEARDYLGRAIRIVVTWSTGTPNNITAIDIHRDSGCMYDTVLIGLGGDGNPSNATRRFKVPVGDTVVNQGQLTALAAQGVATIQDFLSLQITAGT